MRDRPQVTCDAVGNERSAQIARVLGRHVNENEKARISPMDESSCTDGGRPRKAMPPEDVLAFVGKVIAAEDEYLHADESEYGDAKYGDLFLVETLIDRYGCDYDDLDMDELYAEYEEFCRVPLFSNMKTRKYEPLERGKFECLARAFCVKNGIPMVKPSWTMEDFERYLSVGPAAGVDPKDLTPVQLGNAWRQFEEYCIFRGKSYPSLDELRKRIEGRG